MSIHADDEFNLRTGLEFELGDVVPTDGLAGAVITRYRKGRRRRVAGVIGLVVVVAGMGVPLGLATSAPSDPARTVLRVAGYALTLPGQYQVVAARSAPCRPLASGTAEPGNQAGRPDAAAAAIGPSGRCVVLLVTPPFRAQASGSGADPNIPAGARGITVGRYHAWLIPGGGALTLVVEGRPQAGRVQDLEIRSAGLSRSALVSAVSAGLS